MYSAPFKYQYEAPNLGANLWPPSGCPILAAIWVSPSRRQSGCQYGEPHLGVNLGVLIWASIWGTYLGSNMGNPIWVPTWSTLSGMPHFGANLKCPIWEPIWALIKFAPSVIQSEAPNLRANVGRPISEPICGTQSASQSGC